MEREDILDVIKTSLRPRPIVELKPGLSETLRVAREALAAEPYDMLLINELGRLYASEAKWSHCSNILLRGWKRASEIEDAHIRFRFLMKLCEMSFRQSKFKQAFAVLQDIEAPEKGEELKAFLILSVQVCASVGDTQRALRFFQKAVEGETFPRAVRILALTMLDLMKANAFETAKSSLEKLGKDYFDESSLKMLQNFAERQNEKAAQIDYSKLFIGIAVALAVMVVVYLLWLLEQYSLSKIQNPPLPKLPKYKK